MVDLGGGQEKKGTGIRRLFSAPVGPKAQSSAEDETARRSGGKLGDRVQSKAGGQGPEQGGEEILCSSEREGLLECECAGAEWSGHSQARELLGGGG